jgi:hypothetical protein
MGNRTLISPGGTKPAMRSFCAITAAAALTMALASPGESQAPAVAAPAFAYADLADLGLAAPVVAHIRIAEAIALKDARAAGVGPGLTRFYVEADTVSLLRGASGIAARVRYLVDLPRDSAGRAPKLRKRSEHIIFAQPVAGRPGELRLIAPDAQMAWSAGQADLLRAILREASESGAAPQVTGIGRAFHVPGSLPGESETQIFLQTANGRPVSLNVLRRPGQTPRWSVALSEIVDDAARPPRPQTLLWYRLACALPPALPRQSLAEAEAPDAIRADYQLILAGLGRCEKRRS